MHAVSGFLTLCMLPYVAQNKSGLLLININILILIIYGIWKTSPDVLKPHIYITIYVYIIFINKEDIIYYIFIYICEYNSFIKLVKNKKL
jgi:hypothetical protein